MILLKKLKIVDVLKDKNNINEIRTKSHPCTVLCQRHNTRFIYAQHEFPRDEEEHKDAINKKR